MIIAFKCVAFGIGRQVAQAEIYSGWIKILVRDAIVAEFLTKY